jgi:hypothetical protein
MAAPRKIAPAIKPRQIVPLVRPGPAPSAEALAPPAAQLTNHGGPVLGSVGVVAIYWGAYWGGADGTQLATRLDGFFDFILTSSLMDLLAEYSTATTQIGHGRRTAVKKTTTEPGTQSGAGRTVTDEQIQQALQSWINDGTVPRPTANMLYFVYLPPDVVSTMGGQASCQAYCGYHNHVNGTIFYAIEPYLNCVGCMFGNGILDSLTKVSSHELCEAVTDPALNAWFDPNSGDEIGDICNSSVTQLGGYVIQAEWSNRQNRCAVGP